MHFCSSVVMVGFMVREREEGDWIYEVGKKRSLSTHSGLLFEKGR